jgi:hypothetical protein
MRRGVARPANTYVQVRLGWAACLLCPCSRIVRISTGGHAAAMPHHQASDSSRHPCARIYAVCMRSLPAPAAFSLAYPRPPLHPQPHNFGSVFTPLFFCLRARGSGRRGLGGMGAERADGKAAAPARRPAGGRPRPAPSNSISSPCDRAHHRTRVPAARDARGGASHSHGSRAHHTLLALLHKGP